MFPLSRTAYDRFFPNEVDDDKLNNLFLHDLIDAIPNEQYQSFLNECNLASEEELGDFQLNLRNLKNSFTGIAYPTALFSGVAVDNAIRMDLVTKYSNEYNVNRAIVLKFIPLYL